MTLQPSLIECDACGRGEHAPDGPFSLPKGWCGIEVRRQGALRRVHMHACSFTCLTRLLHPRGGVHVAERELEALNG